MSSAEGAITMQAKLSCVHFIREIRAEQGGVVQAVIDLCDAVAAAGHAVTVVTCDATDAPQRWLDQRAAAPQIVLADRSALRSRLLSRSGLETCREAIRQADLVHLHTPWEPSHLQLARLLHAESTPYLVTVHGMLDDWCMAQKSIKKRAFLALGGKRFLEAAGCVHFTAAAERAQALQWIPAAADRSAVVPLVVDLSAFAQAIPAAMGHAPERGSRPEPSKILFLSRLHPKKGVELLLSAAAQLRSEGLAFRLLIAGPGEPGYRAGLEQQARAERIDDRTEWLGMVRGPAKPALYASADVFVLPTFQENFGLVLAEAMASATPVVTTRGTDIWQELQEAGALIADRSPAALATAIRQVLADPAAARKRAAQGREYVQRWLDKDRVVEQYEKLYRTVAQRANDQGARLNAAV
jgi:glycosyltransferase involved in cell wall biosynthesis